MATSMDREATITEPEHVPDWNLIELKPDTGFRFWMPDGLVPSQQREIETTGSYEPATSATLMRFVQPGSAVIECGSNCGFHTLNLAKAVGPQGKVYSYEANPELISILQKNVTSNGYSDIVDIFNQGVWSEDTTLRFPVRKHSLGGAGLKKKFLNPYKRWRHRRKIKRFVDLQVVSLPTLCRERNINFLRMDVEGAEFEAIAGGRALLGERNITIVMEWIPRAGERKLTTSLFDTLQSLGYWTYRISSNGLVRIESGQDLHSGHQEIWLAGQCDLLCLKQDLGAHVERWW